MKTSQAKSSRRRFLFAATAGTAAGAAALIAGKKGVQPLSVPDRSGESKNGYQMTEHVRNYYRTAKI
jgi:hypothetical protein